MFRRVFPRVNMLQPILVSVIVPCRNEIKFIHAFLASLLSQDVTDLNVEFLIADGVSDDGTRSVLSNFEQINSTIRVLDNPGRTAATGLNLAIREAKGDIIVRMD